MSIAEIEAAVIDDVLYRHVLEKLALVAPFQITSDPETDEFYAIDGVSGVCIPGFSTKTEAAAGDAWRKASAALLSSEWRSMLDRLIKAQTLGHVPAE